MKKIVGVIVCLAMIAAATYVGYKLGKKRYMDVYTYKVVPDQQGGLTVNHTFSGLMWSRWDQPGTPFYVEFQGEDKNPCEDSTYPKYPFVYMSRRIGNKQVAECRLKPNAQSQPFGITTETPPDTAPARPGPNTFPATPCKPPTWCASPGNNDTQTAAKTGTPQDPIRKLAYRVVQIVDGDPVNTTVIPLAHNGTLLKWRWEHSFNVQFLATTNPCSLVGSKVLPDPPGAPVSYAYAAIHTNGNWVASCTVAHPEHLSQGFGLQTNDPHLVGSGDSTRSLLYPVTPCGACKIQEGNDTD